MGMAEQQRQVGAGPQQVRSRPPHPASPRGGDLAQPLVGGQRRGRGQVPAGQAAVPHGSGQHSTRALCSVVLPAPPRGLRVNGQHRAGHRRAQLPGGQPGRAGQHRGLHRRPRAPRPACSRPRAMILARVRSIRPASSAAKVAGRPARSRARPSSASAARLVSVSASATSSAMNSLSRAGNRAGRGGRRALGRAAARQLGHRGQLAGLRPGGQPPPAAQHPDQLVVGDPPSRRARRRRTRPASPREPARPAPRRRRTRPRRPSRRGAGTRPARTRHRGRAVGDELRPAPGSSGRPARPGGRNPGPPSGPAALVRRDVRPRSARPARPARISSCDQDCGRPAPAHLPPTAAERSRVSHVLRIQYRIAPTFWRRDTRQARQRPASRRSDRSPAPPAARYPQSVTDFSGVSGLRDEVLLVRDGFGIPHIRAGSAADAWFAMGLACAQDRLFQMDYDRRRACGRWAEIAGPAALGRRRARPAARTRRGRAARRRRDVAAGRGRCSRRTPSGVNAGRSADGRAAAARGGTAVEPWQPWHSVAAFMVRHVLMGQWQHKLAERGAARAGGPTPSTGWRPGPPPGRRSRCRRAGGWPG